MKLVRLGENSGFAQGNNIASGYARGEFLLLLNPDTVILDGAIQRLYDFARKNPGAGIYTGRTVFPDGSLNPTSCFGRVTLWGMFCRGAGLSVIFRGTRLFDPESLGWWKWTDARQVDMVAGCFCLIEKTLWDQLGGFDPAFFMYGEDFDFCLRARRIGYRPLATPDATIIHYFGASDTCPVDRTIKHFRARAQLLRKHRGHLAARLGILMLDLWAFRRIVVGCLPVLNLYAPSEQREAWKETWRRRAEWGKYRP